MPRIYDSASNFHDFCKPHFPSETMAEDQFGDMNKMGEGPDGRGNCFGYDCAHPEYESTDYVCVACKKPLTEKDD